MEENIKATANKIKAEFLKAYYENVYNEILPLENLRIKLLIGVLFFSALIFIVCLSLAYVDTQNIIFKCIWILGWWLGLTFLAILPINSYYKFKLKKFYPKIVESIGLKYSQTIDSNDILSEIKVSGLFPPIDMINNDDVFLGEYKGVQLKILETTIKDSGYIKNKHFESHHSPEIVYKGIIIKLKTNKNVKCITFIKPKMDFLEFKKILKISIWLLIGGIFSFCTMLGGIITAALCTNQLECSEPLQVAFVGFILFVVVICIFIATIKRELKLLKKYKKDIQKINLEDVFFSKYYQAYSYDQIEARYLLTTSFIERFMHLGKAFHSKGLRCSFINDGNIIITIGSKKNEFEIGGLFTSLKKQNHIEKFQEQIVSLLLLVEHFKLDQKTRL